MITLDDPRHPRRIDHWGNDGGDAVRPGPDLGNVEITELRMLLRVVWIAIAEYDGGAPRAWAEALARLDPNKPPGDLPPRRWLRFVDDCGRFLDGGWAVRAAAFGWGPLDLFGCDLSGLSPVSITWDYFGCSTAAPLSSCTVIGRYLKPNAAPASATDADPSKSAASYWHGS